MKLRWDNQHVRWGVTSFLVIAASMLFYYGVFHMKTLITELDKLPVTDMTVVEPELEEIFLHYYGTVK